MSREWAGMRLTTKKVRTGSLIVLSCAIAASLAFAGVSLAGVGPPHPHRAQGSRNVSNAKRLAERRAAARANAGPAVVPDVTYPAEGINVSATAPSSPGPLAPVASSPSTVLSSFRSQPVPQNVLGSTLSTQTPAIDLRTVTELHLVSSDVTAGTPFTAWVVTYTNTSSPVIGPSDVNSVSGCTSVGIMDSSTGVWTDFFQECGTST